MISSNLVVTLLTNSAPDLNTLRLSDIIFFALSAAPEVDRGGQPVLFGLAIVVNEKLILAVGDSVGSAFHEIAGSEIELGERQGDRTWRREHRVAGLSIRHRDPERHLAAVDLLVRHEGGRGDSGGMSDEEGLARSDHGGSGREEGSRLEPPCRCHVKASGRGE